MRFSLCCSFFNCFADGLFSVQNRIFVCLLHVETGYMISYDQIYSFRGRVKEQHFLSEVCFVLYYFQVIYTGSSQPFPCAGNSMLICSPVVLDKT